MTCIVQTLNMYECWCTSRVIKFIWGQCRSVQATLQHHSLGFKPLHGNFKREVLCFRIQGTLPAQVPHTYCATEFRWRHHWSPHQAPVVMWCPCDATVMPSIELRPPPANTKGARLGGWSCCHLDHPGSHHRSHRNSTPGGRSCLEKYCAPHWTANWRCKESEEMGGTVPWVNTMEISASQLFA